ncbi:hypothetical protein [Rhodococcus kronopolitis]|uniref:Uncharacterized protein n=1 Tax=Rhodococcus kronopolitis TaxID=1460226 RepID=A0ABV9FRM7_9NOCA
MTANGVVRVDHHQFILGSAETDTLATTTEGSLIDLGPGFVTVRTGIAYGPALLSVELHGQSPAPSASDWEVVEEGSITVDEPIHVLTLDGEVVSPFDETLRHVDADTYRVRVSARGRDLKWDMDVSEPVESYSMDLWRAPFGKFEQIKKQDQAWSEGAESDDTSPAAEDTPSLGDLVDSGVSGIRGTPRLDVSLDPQLWDGRPPTGALLDTVSELAESKANRQTIKQLMWLSFLNRDALEVVVGSDARQKDEIARWAVERAYQEAGLLEFEWARKGIEALLAHQPLPDPFDGKSGERDVIAGDPDFSRTRVHAISILYPASQPYERWNIASYTIYQATSGSPHAVFNTLWNAVMTAGQEGYQELLEDLVGRFS